jgi:hypothetical protein
MSQNGQPAQPLTLQQRIAPARVAQLEQAQLQLSAVVVGRAMEDVRALNNALHFLTEQANIGNAPARDLLKLFFGNLDAAKAAAAGIALPGK